MASHKLITKDTFLRYNNPIVISKQSEDSKMPGMKTQIPISNKKSKADLSMLSTKKNQSIEDVLNCIFPPKEWEENGKRWMQTVSSEPGTKEDVNKLGEDLDSALRQQEARDTGICPVRRKLLDQCFDELIRQEAINCCERGLLIMLIRDNLQMELKALETLYESNIAYAIRKTLLVEEEKENMKECIAAENEKKISLEKEIEELNLKIQNMEIDEDERRVVAIEKHKKEVELLRAENHILKDNLEKIVYPKKSSA